MAGHLAKSPRATGLPLRLDPAASLLLPSGLLGRRPGDPPPAALAGSSAGVRIGLRLPGGGLPDRADASHDACSHAPSPSGQTTIGAFCPCALGRQGPGAPDVESCAACFAGRSVDAWLDASAGQDLPAPEGDDGPLFTARRADGILDIRIGRGFQPLIEEAVVGLLTATAAGAPVLATLPPGRPSYAAPPESPAPAPAPAPARGILSLRSAELAQQVVAKLAAFRRQALEAELRQTATGAPVGSALPACGGSAIHQALAPLVARDPVLRVLEAVRDRPPPQVDLLLELVDWTPAGQWIPDVWELSSREAILAETLRLRGLGNALFQAGRFGPAAAVYHHALCFMDLHFSSLFSSSGASRAHASSADGRAAGAESPGPAECPAFLQRTLRLNHAACSLKLNRPLEALSQLNRVLAPQPGECPAAGPKQRAGCDTCHPAHRANSPDGVYCTQDRTEPQFRKARYRRAQAHFALGAYDDALADLSKIPGPEASGLEKQIHRAMKRNRGMFS